MTPNAVPALQSALAIAQFNGQGTSASRTAALQAAKVLWNPPVGVTPADILAQFDASTRVYVVMTSILVRLNSCMEQVLTKPIKDSSGAVIANPTQAQRVNALLTAYAASSPVDSTKWVLALTGLTDTVLANAIQTFATTLLSATDVTVTAVPKP